jgi:hypothetical protein
VSVVLNKKWNVAHTASLTVDYDGEQNAEAPRRLFVKIAETDDPMADIFPGEYTFYAEQRHTKLPLAACFGAFREQDTLRTCVLLEDLTATHSQTTWPSPPPVALCEAAVGTLARLHAHWWNDGEFEWPETSSRLQSNEESLACYFQPLVLAFLDDLDECLSVYQREVIELVCCRIPELKTRRATLASPGHANAR